MQGLVVPVIRNVDKMNFAEIEKGINTLAKKANDGTISIDEMAGGSFTVSNGGVYGSLISTPIINPPQVGLIEPPLNPLPHDWICIIFHGLLVHSFHNWTLYYYHPFLDVFILVLNKKLKSELSWQSAILGMHSIVSRPVVVGGNVVPRPMMYIALTYDHRLIDGREAVFFLRRIKDVVEDPRRLLLDI